MKRADLAARYVKKRMTTEVRELCLLVRVGTQLCALPLENIEETMRPQPVHAVAGAPSFVRGIAVIRGVPVPVVDAASVLGEEASRPTRFVTLRTGERRVAFAVHQVLGVTGIDRKAISDLPPLLARASVDVVSAIGTLDAEMLLVLRSAKLVPETVWTEIETGDSV